MAEDLEAEVSGNSFWRADMPLYSDYDRIHILLMNADKYYVQIIELDFTNARKLYGVLRAIFLMLNPFFAETDEKENIEKLFKAIDAETKRIYSLSSKGELDSIDPSLVDKFDELYKKLTAAKQSMGLGIRIRRDVDAKSRLKEALGV
jgi:hypothetical protein